ncbi:MAG TPA: GMC oxidoreductase [Vicinamibacteria bacterium]|nr:GMC oxidoreductase [Vicinamibacteria bacterium]
MDPVVVVGSGASGVHFALTALEKGRRVVMLDVGRRRPEPLGAAETFDQLKTSVSDPVQFFLGKDYEALTFPDDDEEYYALAPNQHYVVEPLDRFRLATSGFSPLVSFAAGGLGEIWCAGCYPLNDADLEDYPFTYADLAPYYETVARRIGVAGEADDLSRFYPVQEGLLPPLDLDEHSRVLLETYRKRKAALNGSHGCFVGRARVATLSQDLNGRKACSYLGRCRWGCPNHSIYVPTLTLSECLAHDRFTYVPDVHVSHFVFGSDNRVRKVVARSVTGDARHEFDAEALVLAAGTLSSSKIFLDSVYRDSGERLTLRGLLDNRQVLMPFVNLGLIGKPFDPESYQYQQVVIALDAEEARDRVYGLVTTLKTALIHPIVASFPTSMRTGLSLFRDIHGALAMLNVNFSDRRREENQLSIEADGKDGTTTLRVDYVPEPNESAKIARVTKRFRRILRKLGCIAPKNATHVRPMGASVHYAGTIPMSENGSGPTTDEVCRSRDFDNLHFVDGTTFPSLPAKNLTFTLMANASRVADLAF